MSGGMRCKCHSLRTNLLLLSINRSGNTFLAAVAAGGGDKAASEAKQGNLRESEGEALVRPADLELSEVKVK